MTEIECVVTEDKPEEKLYENWFGHGVPDSPQTKSRVVRKSRSILNKQVRKKFKKKLFSFIL